MLSHIDKYGQLAQQHLWGGGGWGALAPHAFLWSSLALAYHVQVVQECCFLPQKPYMPLGSLRQQLLFPLSDDESTAASTHGFSDASLRELAATAHLPRTLHNCLCSVTCDCMLPQ